MRDDAARDYVALAGVAGGAGSVVRAVFEDVPMTRPSWPDVFLAVAETVSARAECRRRKVGAVVVNAAGRVVSTGVNGTLPGAPSCLDGACPRGMLTYEQAAACSDYSNCIATHAERSALHYTPADEREGSTVYVNHAPCPGCQTLMESVRVARVVWPDGEKVFGKE